MLKLVQIALDENTPSIQPTETRLADPGGWDVSDSSNIVSDSQWRTNMLFKKPADTVLQYVINITEVRE